MSNFGLPISPNLYFDRLFLLKVYTISAKKVQRSYDLWHCRMMQNLKKNWFVNSKMTRIWWILILALESLKNFHFDWSLLTSKSTEELSFMTLKSHVNFEEKPRYFHGILKVENAWAKNLRRSCVMALKNDEKSEEELTCRFKIDIRNLMNFDLRTQKSQKFTL